jgi:hypothetical protein
MWPCVHQVSIFVQLGLSKNLGQEKEGGGWGLWKMYFKCIAALLCVFCCVVLFLLLQKLDIQIGKVKRILAAFKH